FFAVAIAQDGFEHDRMGTGSLETGPAPDFSSCGNEWSEPCFPLPRSNDCNALNEFCDWFINLPAEDTPGCGRKQWTRGELTSSAQLLAGMPRLRRSRRIQWHLCGKNRSLWGFVPPAVTRAGTQRRGVPTDSGFD